MVKNAHSSSSGPRQSTLAFKTTGGRISKSSAFPGKATKPTVAPPLKTDVVHTPSAPATPSPASVKSFSTFEEVATPVREEDELDIAARAIGQKKITEYFQNAIIKPRMTDPVHQEELTLDEKILRHFDLSSEYGPFVGISRLDRWKRAQNLGLEPPMEVLAVIQHIEDAHGKGGQKGRDERLSYIDEFLRGGAE